MSDFEEVVKPDRIGLYDQDGMEVRRYRPPPPHKTRFKRQVLQVENWIHRHGMVTKEDVLLYIMRAFDMELPQAKGIYKQVEQDLDRMGRVYGK